MRILMVENHEVFAKTVTQAFLDGHAVRIVPTLAAARTALANSSFDAILVDYDLDDGKGDQLVASVRSTHPEAIVLGISAHDPGNDALLRAGAQAARRKTRFAELPLLLNNLSRRRRFLLQLEDVEYEGVVLIEGREDRAIVRRYPWGVAVIVADGAGGTGSGGEAADCALDRIHQGLLVNDKAPEPLEVADLLSNADQCIAEAGLGGESTAAVCCVHAGLVTGASVGDSEIHLIGQDADLHLTRDQRRKPLLGSGRSLPTAFETVRFDGILVAATDGLFGYLAPGGTRALSGNGDLEAVTESMVDSIRLRTGDLPDDVAVVVIRRTPDLADTEICGASHR